MHLGVPTGQQQPLEQANVRVLVVDDQDAGT